MATYKNIIAWQKAVDLADATYRAVRSFPKSELFGLSAQMRSAAISIASNIAEGRGRGTDRDYRSFLIRARGSLFELETQIQIAARLELIDAATGASLLALSAEVGKKLGSLIRYLGGQPSKG